MSRENEREGSQGLFSVRMRASKGRRHISGAEGLVGALEAQRTAAGYVRRAMNHEKGSPDRVVVTIEEVRSRPMEIQGLPVRTLDVSDGIRPAVAVRRLLLAAGVETAGIESAFAVLKKSTALRGAALMNTDGIRLDPDLERGVRVSRIGLSRRGRMNLGRRLSGLGINSERVREAVVLASKALHHPTVLAELCISDDPGYTTGYVATRHFGYVRIPGIKGKDSERGGRVFFVSGTEPAGLIAYLQETPVLVTEAGFCRPPEKLPGILMDSLSRSS